MKDIIRKISTVSFKTWPEDVIYKDRNIKSYIIYKFEGYLVLISCLNIKLNTIKLVRLKRAKLKIIKYK